MSKTNSMVKDALLGAVICVLMILFNSLLTLSSVIPSMIIIVLIGCYYQNKSIKRSIILALLVVFLCFIFIDPLSVIICILPSSLLGVVASQLFKNVKNIKLFYSIIFISFLLINFIKDIAIAKYLLNIDFLEYLTTDKLVKFSDKISNKDSVFICAYILAQIFISILEVIILHKSNNIYKKRIMKLLGESGKSI